MHASLKVRVMRHRRHTFEADLWRNSDDSATDTFQGLPVLSMSRPPTTQEVKVDAILFSSGHRSVRPRCGGGRNALAIQVVLVLHLKISFSTFVLIPLLLPPGQHRKTCQSCLTNETQGPRDL